MYVAVLRDLDGMQKGFDGNSMYMTQTGRLCGQRSPQLCLSLNRVVSASLGPCNRGYLPPVVALCLTTMLTR